ncbi:MAG: T9SS type A sorting domain-containing protein [Sporocytophaga sp.]|nr:T9SS type A sorting domain-containing protein [Sporocytophaga sp.]
MDKAILIFGLLIITTYAKAQLAFEWYYKDNFNMIYESSQGEKLSINVYYNSNNERKVEFIKLDYYGEIYFRKETTDILPWYEYYFVTPNDEVIISTEVGFKKFNFNGDFLGTTSTAEMGPFIIDEEGKYIISQRLSSDCNVTKLNTDGTIIWKNSIPKAKYITPPIEIDGKYVVGVRTANKVNSDSIQFIKYGTNGNVAISKQYAMNDDVLEMHNNTSGLYAITRKGLMISMNENLDTLWTKKIATRIDESKGNEKGIYFYEFEDAPFGTQSIKKVNFDGDVAWEYTRYSGIKEFIRSVTLTKDDNVWLVCSTRVSNNLTLVLKPLNDPITNNPESLSNSFNIYPNPVEINESLLISSKIARGTLNIFDQFGYKVYKVLIDKNETEIENSLTKGIYFYQVEQNNSILKSGKIVVN